jgi:type 1 fimbria pilin
MKLFNKSLVLLGALFSASTSYAVCSLSYPLIADTTEYGATPIQFGTLNLASAYLQPVGTILGNTVIPSPVLRNATSPEQAIWTCDKADLPNIFFLVATNGDEPWGGYIDIGGPDGLTDVYATWWKYVGIKLQMNDVVFTRYWQKLNIPSYGERADGKIDIRVKDIPPLEVTLYRVSSAPVRPRPSVCYDQATNGSYNGGYIGNVPAVCNQPSGYLQLAGNGQSTFTFYYDAVGTDSNSNWLFYGVYNGFGYGFFPSSTRLSTADTCVVRNATPIVNFGSIPAPDLNREMVATATLNVEVECSNTAVSGVDTDQVAIGFLPSTAALNNAQTLGLLSSNGSSEYLVSDDYNNDMSAKGVGIQIRNSRSGTNMRFLSASAPYAIGGGNGIGWYPVLEGSPDKISSITGYTTYSQQYDAILKKLPNQSIKAGQVKATATVIVKVQ